MSVSKSLRYQILRRDEHTCRYCGRSAPEVKLVIDHVVPTTLGGRDEPSNLATACHDCNSGKSATPPDASLVADVSADALRWAAARTAAAADLAEDRLRRDDNRSEFLDAWNIWTYTGSDGEEHTLPLPNNWPMAIDRFVEAGLSIEDLADAVDITMRTEKVKDTFRYFCGVAGGMARRLDEKTQQYIADEDRDETEGTNGEGRVGCCRISCPECAADVEVAVEVLRNRRGEPLKVRGTPLGPDPFGSTEPEAPTPADIFDGIFGWISETSAAPMKPPSESDVLTRMREGWVSAAGEELAARAELLALRGGELVIGAANAEWRTEVRLHSKRIVQWLNEEFRGAVTSVRVKARYVNPDPYSFLIADVREPAEAGEAG